MSSQWPLPCPGDVVANRYRVDAPLGQGGMGAAYAATNLVTGKRVALKWILREHSAARLHRLLREAKAASRVKHPNIVDVYDVGEHEGALFLVMELLTGQSLQGLIQAQAPLDLADVLAWLLPVLRGVRAAHRSGVIHRDLKPANVFLCQGDVSDPPLAKVLDFGVSKIVTPLGSDDDPSLTDSGALMGTPSYMAPEQLEDSRKADERSDIYACGVLLYHALSGRRPFEADSYPSLVRQILAGEPTPLHTLRPALPAGVCDAVHTAMSRDREQRFRNVDQLMLALVPFTGSSFAPGSRAQPPSGEGPGLRSSLLWVVLVAAGLGAGLAWRTRGQAPIARVAARNGIQARHAAAPLSAIAPRATGDHLLLAQSLSDAGACVSDVADRWGGDVRTATVHRTREARRARAPARASAIREAAATPTEAGPPIVPLQSEDF